MKNVINEFIRKMREAPESVEYYKGEHGSYWCETFSIGEISIKDDNAIDMHISEPIRMDIGFFHKVKLGVAFDNWKIWKLNEVMATKEETPLYHNGEPVKYGNPFKEQHPPTPEGLDRARERLSEKAFEKICSDDPSQSEEL